MSQAVRRQNPRFREVNDDGGVQWMQTAWRRRGKKKRRRGMSSVKEEEEE